MIHKFSMFGTNIVVDVNSGAVHVFDDISYELLSMYEAMLKEKRVSLQNIIETYNDRYDPEKIREAFDEIEYLKKEGLLFSEDIYEDAAVLWKREPVVKALCLHISHDCNLRCKYCFAGTGNFGGQRTMMSAEVGKKAIDFLIANSKNRRNLEIDFFGGEPLMNFQVVKDIIEYARSREQEAGKKFKFTLTTNGVLLNDEIRNYLNDNIQNVVLSLDGRKEINDLMRTRVDGRGIYDSIVPKLLEVAESRKQDNYYVRGTFTRENLDFSKDVLHLADLGFKQVSVEPVVAAKDTGFDLREEDLSTLYSEYEELAKEYVNRKEAGSGFNFFHFLLDLSQGPCVSKRLSGCGSGHDYMAVTPEGDLYPCHQFVGMQEYYMGSVFDGIKGNELQQKFLNSNVYTKEACRGCWAKFYCSGGCPANAIQFNEDIGKPYEIGCKLERKRVECALWIQTRHSS